MTDEKLLDSHALIKKNFLSTEDFLAQFAQCSLFTFSAKDVKTQKIFIHNTKCAELYGLEDKGLVGLTSRDCLEQIKPFKQKDDALSKWQAEDQKALAYNTAQRKVITILDYTGFIRVREHLTIPLSNRYKEKIALSAFCYDRTQQMGLLSLFEQYQKYYPKNQAIIQFGRYLDIDTLFEVRLTAGELYTLLALAQTSRHKRAAYLLSLFREKAISPTTISGYVERIKDKLKASIELERVIIYLRNVHQWTPDQDIF